MKGEPAPGRLLIALGEYDTGWHSPDASLDKVETLARQAASDGADLLVLPEMCTTGFTMDPRQNAVARDSDSVRRLRRIASDSSVHLIAGVATREDAPERFFNSAFFITSDGEIAAEYRKQRLFRYADENRVYSAGSSSTIVTMNGLRLALFICYDLRFPELFREVAPECDAIIVLANWPSARQSHWRTLLRARAIESQCFVVGVNRTGHGGNLDYLGASEVIDPWGDPIDPAIPSTRLYEIRRDEVSRVRRSFPFIEDRR